MDKKFGKLPAYLFMMNDALQLSQQFVKLTRANKDVSQYISTLASFDRASLYKQLHSDDLKKTFWINIYNAYGIHLLKKDPKVLLSPIPRKRHFSKKSIIISEKKLSLDDIEHGLIRSSKIWWSKGYLSKWYVCKFESKLKTSKVDPRIHFALNCGGASCPPIKFYHPDTIDSQLDVATKAFLFSEAEFNPSNNLVKISRLFDWYSGDFGGKKGIIDLLQKFNIVPGDASPSILYSKYDWKPLALAFSQ